MPNIKLHLIRENLFILLKKVTYAKLFEQIYKSLEIQCQKILKLLFFSFFSMLKEKDVCKMIGLSNKYKKTFISAKSSNSKYRTAFLTCN